MDVTQKLKEEHQLILRFLDLLCRYSDEAEQRCDAGVLVEKIDGFLDFIVNFADRYHHGKEEEVLFKHLSRPGVLSHCNPLPQMLLEHDMGRGFVDGMRRASRNGDLHALVANARSFAELLEQHIYKEDNILYEMAEEGLADNHKIEIHAEYESAEEKHGGIAIVAKFEALKKELEAGLKTIAEAG